jgi:hypothetical protein
VVTDSKLTHYLEGVLDVGGGDSQLVDALVAKSLTCLAVLDISAPVCIVSVRPRHRCPRLVIMTRDATSDACFVTPLVRHPG